MKFHRSAGPSSTLLALYLVLASMHSAQAVVIAVDDFSERADLFDFSGSAAVIGNPGYLRLTEDGQTNQAGSAYLKTPLNVTPDIGFTTTFEFQIQHNGGRASEAEGFAFLILPTNPEFHRLGNAGAGLGYLEDRLPRPVILPHLAIEFDTHEDPDFFDASGEHIALTRFFPGALPGPDPQTSGTAYLASVDAQFADGLEHTVRIDYAQYGTKLLRVFLDGRNLLEYDFAHVGWGLNDPDLGRAGFGDLFATGFGFSASTGAGTATHRIDSWRLTVPEPPIAWLLMAGLLALGRWRGFPGR